MLKIGVLKIELLMLGMTDFTKAKFFPCFSKNIVALRLRSGFSSSIFRIFVFYLKFIWCWKFFVLNTPSFRFHRNATHLKEGNFGEF
jgi:hypothetical protein